MRVLLIGLVIAVILQLPSIAEHMGRDLPPALTWLGIPFTGLDYMGVFFHELGHTVARWLFGYPAIPTFDFESGGGMTYAPQERNSLVLALVYLGFAYVAYLIWKEEAYGILAAFLGFVGFHIVMSLTKGNEIICVYMGHGGEMMVAAFCMVMAALNLTDRDKGPVERYLNMVFGIFIFIRDGLLNYDLMTDAFARERYTMAKGGHCQMDFDRIAELLHTNVQHVAAFSTVFMMLLLAGVLYIIVTTPEQKQAI